MQVKAVAKNVGISPRKVHMVAVVVKGQRVSYALHILRNMPSPAARAVAKVVKSAAANAENNYQMSADALKIMSVLANQGVTQKRFDTKARGRGTRVLKRSSHITVIVDEEA